MADPLARPTLSFGNLEPIDPLAASARDFAMSDGTVDRVQFDEVRQTDAGEVGVVWSDEDRAARAAGVGAAAAEAAIEAAPQYDADGLRIASPAQTPDAGASGADDLAQATPEPAPFSVSTGDAATDWALQQAGFTGADAVLNAFDAEGKFVGKDMLGAGALLAAQDLLAQQGINPGSKKYKEILGAEVDRITSKSTLALNLARSEAQTFNEAQAAAARSAEGGAAAGPGTVGTLWRSFASSFIESGGADTVELANMGASAAMNLAESGTLTDGGLNRVDLLTDVSDSIRDVAGSMRDYAALNEGYAAGDAAFKQVWADESAGTGSKLVDTAGVVLSNPTWMGAQVAGAVGYVGGLLLGSKGAGVAAKAPVSAVKATVNKATAARVAAAGEKAAAELAAKAPAVQAATAAVTAAGAAADTASAAVKAAGWSNTALKRTKLAATFGAYAGAAASADVREQMAGADPTAIRASQGWADTASDLELGLGRAPSDDEVYNAMLGRSQAMSAGTTGAVTFATTLLSPAVEGTIAGLFTKGAAGGLSRSAVSGLGGRVTSGVGTGLLEGATEGVQEFIQTAAPAESLRAQMTGRSLTDVLGEAMSNRDYQSAAAMGAVLGFGLGSAAGASNFGRGEAVDVKALRSESDTANAALKEAENQLALAQGEAEAAQTREAAAKVQAAAAAVHNAEAAARAAESKVDILAQPATGVVAAPRLVTYQPDAEGPTLVTAPPARPNRSVADQAARPDPLAGRVDPFARMLSEAGRRVEAGRALDAVTGGDGPLALPAPDPNAPLVTPRSAPAQPTATTGTTANQSARPDPLAGRVDLFGQLTAEAGRRVEAGRALDAITGGDGPLALPAPDPNAPIITPRTTSGVGFIPGAVAGGALRSDPLAGRVDPFEQMMAEAKRRVDAMPKQSPEAIAALDQQEAGAQLNMRLRALQIGAPRPLVEAEDAVMGTAMLPLYGQWQAQAPSGAMTLYASDSLNLAVAVGEGGVLVGRANKAGQVVWETTRDPKYARIAMASAQIASNGGADPTMQALAVAISRTIGEAQPASLEPVAGEPPVRVTVNRARENAARALLEGVVRDISGGATDTDIRPALVRAVELRTGQTATFGPKGGGTNNAATLVAELGAKARTLSILTTQAARKEFDLSTPSKILGEAAKVTNRSLAKAARGADMAVDLRRGKTRVLAAQISGALNGDSESAITRGQLRDVILDPARTESEQDLARFAITQLAELSSLYVRRGELEGELYGEEISPSPLTGFESQVRLDNLALTALARAAAAAAVDGRLSVNPETPVKRVGRQRKNPDAPVAASVADEVAAITKRHAKNMADIAVGSGTMPEVAALVATGGAEEFSVSSAAALGAGIDSAAADMQRRGVTAEADSDVRARMGSAEPLVTHITEEAATAVIDSVRSGLAKSGAFARVQFNQYPDFETANEAEGGRLIPGAAGMVMGEGAEARVVIIRDRIESEAHLQRVLGHEIVGHLGVRNILGRSGLRDVSASLRALAATSKVTAAAVKTVDTELRRQYTAMFVSRFGVRSLEELTVQQQDVVRRSVADELKNAEYDGRFSEEVLAYASESYTNAKVPSQKSAMARILQWFSDKLFGASGVRIRSEADLARLLYDARLVTVGKLPVQSYSGRTDRRAISGSLLSRMRTYATDAQADFYKVLQIGDVVADSLDASSSSGGRTRESVQRTMRAARNAVNVQAELARQVDGVVAPARFALLDAIRETRKTNDLARTLEEKAMQDRANQHIYLVGAKERIDYLLTSEWIEQNLNNPAAADFIQSYDAAIAEIEALLATVPQGEAFNPQSEVPLIKRGREIYANWAAGAVVPEGLQTLLADQSRGKSLVGFSKAEIDEQLRIDTLYGVEAAVEKSGITGANGVLDRASDLLLTIRRRGDYGDSGTARAIMANMRNYVPMMDIDADTGVRTGSGGSAFAGMSRVAPDLEGRAELPEASPFEQLARMARSVAADVPTRRINQGLLDIITDNNNAVRPEFRRIFKLLADKETKEFITLSHADAATKLQNMSRADQERTQVVYFDGGNATLLTVIDDNVRDAMFARFKPRWEDTLENVPARAAMRSLRAATRTMSLTLTGANPMFWPKQLARDMSQLLLQSGFEQKVGAGRTARAQLDSLRYLPVFTKFAVLTDAEQTAAITAALADPKDPLHKFALRSSYGGAARYAAQLGDPLSISSLAGSPLGIRASRTGEVAGRYLMSGANAVEQAGRQAMFDAVYDTEIERRVADAKKSNLTVDMDAIRDAAASAASEASVEIINFGQRSNLGEFMGTFLPFAQTALTGAEQIFTRRIWKDGKAPVEMVETAPGQWRQRLKPGWMKQINMAQIATMSAMSLASTTVAISYAMTKAEDEGLERDEWYKVINPSAFTKALSLPMGDGAPLTWQVQPGWFQYVHGSVALLVAAANGFPMEDLGSEAVGHTLYNLTPVNSRLGTDLGTDSFLEQFLPAVIMPIVQMATNRDAFGTRVRQVDGDTGEAEGVSTYRGNPTTSDIYTSMARFVDETFGGDPSPDTFRHLIRSYGGGFGQMLDTAARHMQSQVNGLDTSLTETVATATGLLAKESTSTSQRLFFDQRDRLVVPLSQAYERAVRADQAAGRLEVDYSNAPAGSYVQQLDAVLGRGSLKAILGPDRRRVQQIGELRTEYMQYAGTGDATNISRIREEMEAVYGSTYTGTRQTFEKYGVREASDLSWLDDFYPRR